MKMSSDLKSKHLKFSSLDWRKERLSSVLLQKQSRPLNKGNLDFHPQTPGPVAYNIDVGGLQGWHRWSNSHFTVDIDLSLQVPDKIDI